MITRASQPAGPWYLLSLLCSVRGMRWPDPQQPDPIIDEQVRVLFALLGGPVSDEELEGFLIICSRLVGVAGSPRVSVLEEWLKRQHKWKIVWPV